MAGRGRGRGANLALGGGTPLRPGDILALALGRGRGGVTGSGPAGASGPGTTGRAALAGVVTAVPGADDPTIPAAPPSMADPPRSHAPAPYVGTILASQRGGGVVGGGTAGAFDGSGGGSGAVATTSRGSPTCSESCDCAVCMEAVGPTSSCWQCPRCFAQFHLPCMQAWASNSIRPASRLLATLFTGIRNVWHCPTCRAEFGEADYPAAYRCFCGRRTNPEPDAWLAPHTCGGTCGRTLPTCSHMCTNQCHAGPCPRCPQTVPSSCYCGKVATTRRCGTHEFSCGAVCGGARQGCPHPCDVVCHPGPCPPCVVEVTMQCRCRAATRVGPCHAAVWQCDKPCGRPLTCGHHTCEAVCHAGPCGPCPLSEPRKCPCGKSTFRLPCTEPTPRCGDTCGRPLSCGHHACSDACHAGPCRPCDEAILGACRCGKVTKRHMCSEPLLCSLKCRRTRACGRHECKVVCHGGECPPCREICGRPLACGYHSCQALCHAGPCEKCPAMATVSCACGVTTVRVPCGAQGGLDVPCVLRCRAAVPCHHGRTTGNAHTCHAGPCPSCTEVCGTARARCDHRCPSACHYPGPCPPCEVPVDRPCVGRHTHRSQPCSAPVLWRCDLACGVSCPCGHRCERPCHAGACPPCVGRCAQPRPAPCTHDCPAGACHAGAPCPPCSVPVRKPCHCGKLRLAFTGTCAEWCALVDRGPPAAEEALCCLAACGKPSGRVCGHPCPATCHGGPCDDAGPCTTMVRSACRCGGQKVDARCGATVTAPGVTSQRLDCDPSAGCRGLAAASAGPTAGGTASVNEEDDAGPATSGTSVVPGRSFELRRRRRLEQQEADARATAESDAATKRRQAMLQLLYQAVSLLGFGAFLVTLALYLAGYFK